MRTILVLAAVLCCGALGAGVALGVTGGSPDSTHAYVGAAVQQQTQNGVVGSELCSGFLISSTTFVTAAHCFADGSTAYVTFDQALSKPVYTATGVPTNGTYLAGTVQWNPAYCPSCGPGGTPLNDVAVIHLKEPAPITTYATLPVPGADSGLAKKQAVAVVGYGLQGGSSKAAVGIREGVVTSLKDAGGADPNYLRLFGQPGACEGDSGGPDLVGDTAVALNTFVHGNSACSGSTFSQRLDTPATYGFLEPYAAA